MPIRMNTAAPRRHSGMSMIEVLVTLVILLVGLLGLAGLMTQAQRSEMEAYQRAQAVILLQDMAGRLNANRKVTTYRNIKVGLGAPVVANGANIAQQDLYQWQEALLGAAEASGNKKVGALIGAIGCIDYDSGSEVANTSGQDIITHLDGAQVTTVSGGKIPNSGTYTVSVAWQGMGETSPPAGTITCGSGSYSSEAMRRVVSTPIRFAALAAR